MNKHKIRSTILGTGWSTSGGKSCEVLKDMPVRREMQIREKGKQKKEQGAIVSKRRKYELVGKEWGKQDTRELLNKEREPEPVTEPPEPSRTNSSPP